MKLINFTKRSPIIALPLLLIAAGTLLSACGGDTGTVDRRPSNSIELSAINWVLPAPGAVDVPRDTSFVFEVPGQEICIASDIGQSVYVYQSGQAPQEGLVLTPATPINPIDGSQCSYVFDIDQEKNLGKTIYAGDYKVAFLGGTGDFLDNTFTFKFGDGFNQKFSLDKIIGSGRDQKNFNISNINTFGARGADGKLDLSSETLNDLLQEFGSGAIQTFVGLFTGLQGVALSETTEKFVQFDLDKPVMKRFLDDTAAAIYVNNYILKFKCPNSSLATNEDPGLFTLINGTAISLSPESANTVLMKLPKPTDLGAMDDGCRMVPVMMVLTKNVISTIGNKLSNTYTVLTNLKRW